MTEMERLKIIICENYSPEFTKALALEGYEDVDIQSFPCLCARKQNQEKIRSIIEQMIIHKCDSIVLGSHHCAIFNQEVVQKSVYKTYLSEYCFSHMAHKQLIEYIIAKGGYILSPGWLDRWEQRLEENGFDRETGRRFYKEFCSELVYFDMSTDKRVNEKLVSLSQYLDIPYRIISMDMHAIRIFLRSIVYEWRLNKIVVEGCDIQQAEIQYSRINEAVASMNATTDLQLSLSVGYATTDNDSTEIELLIRASDKAMYANKALRK